MVMISPGDENLVPVKVSPKEESQTEELANHHNETGEVKSEAIEPNLNLIIIDTERNITYRKGKMLGSGAYAKCYEVAVVDSNPEERFACKIITKTSRTKTRTCQLEQEIKIHKELSHRHVVRFYSHFEDEDNVYIILELCAALSLKEMLKRRTFFTEPEARYFIWQISMALIYLHDEMRVIHRDLKPANLFINGNMELKLGDFGFSTSYVEGEDKPTERCGTPNYISPEVLEKAGHGYEVDIWSLGCLLYTFLVGKPPFETSSFRDTYAKIKAGEYSIPPTASRRVGDDALDLISQTLQVDPSRRPNATDVMRHSFLTNSTIPPYLPVSCLSNKPFFENGIPLNSTLSNWMNNINNSIVRRRRASTVKKWKTVVPRVPVIEATSTLNNATITKNSKNKGNATPPPDNHLSFEFPSFTYLFN